MEFYLSHTTALQLFRAMKIKVTVIYHDSSVPWVFNFGAWSNQEGISKLRIMLTNPIELVVGEKKIPIEQNK